jgi:hypothetical protein
MIPFPKTKKHGLPVRLLLIAGIALGALLTAANVNAQETYTGEKVDYTVEFPSAAWRLAKEPDDTHLHAEWIYGDRLDGYLRISKEALESNTDVRDFAHFDQDTRIRFLPGYIDVGKEEKFAGRLQGWVLSYEFTQTGKTMAGRTYYLQADSRTVYALRFTGLRDKLIRIRNQTDQIARSFRLK